MADENQRPTPGADEANPETEKEAAAAEADERPGNPDGTAEASGDVTARLQQAEEQLQAYKDQALRAKAEAENTRRRAVRDVENAHKFALERFTSDLLPVLDSFEKAVETASESEGAEPIAEGVELSLKLFLSVLEKHGVERLDPTGEPFDPQFHEAMTMMPSETAEPNSVLEVMQRGYVLNGRLVRAAKVVVARAPDADPARGGS